MSKRFNNNNNNNDSDKRMKFNNNNNNNNNRNNNNSKDTASLESQIKDTEIISLFKGFSQKLDEDNDRRERIVKISRDITISSKRLISLLQRACWENKQDIIVQAKEDLDKIHLLFGTIITELNNQEYWKFQRSFTWGVQEYIESFSFLYFLENGTLIPLDYIHNSIKESLKLESLGQFSISMEDYYLGLADLTGELMRYSTNSTTQKKYDDCYQICDFVRVIHSGFSLCHLNRDLNSKLNLIDESLKKIEKLCFSIRVRGSEFPDQIMFGLDGGEQQQETN
ncbi:hypothetical protein CYY_004989 [Polysphondylium violaceum]|uniref:Translin family protein n=1 Tax=Polysphondylium violaceum TaxID=133409 RepID=A0A8J4PUH4_9MYCE|nr:hypothetical protein CYY_004989 [Polysphondylium violaceum]